MEVIDILEKNKNENQISEGIIKLIHSLFPLRTSGSSTFFMTFFMFLVFKILSHIAKVNTSDLYDFMCG